ncbi:Trimeric LpxA-like enzyme [Perilla frutescens var. frutescens]|nr:Trimeric LpxA-like enzyme [Perilla frutescens var. frutescens]
MWEKIEPSDRWKTAATGNEYGLVPETAGLQRPLGMIRRGQRCEDTKEELTRVPLQAIVLADSFATLFRHITLERPKVLLPLVNAPMIEYTLAWLESAGVEEVFVFCCAHSKLVTDNLQNSDWLNNTNLIDDRAV